MLGDLEEVMRLIQEDPEVVGSTDFYNGTTALHGALDYGHVKVACYLPDQGADINARDCYGHTPMYKACREGRLGVVELLVLRAADPTIRTTSSDRWTPLMIAAYGGHVEVTRYLLRIRAVRATGSIDAQNTHGQTALLWAACEGHVEVVKLLVDAGANSVVAKSTVMVEHQWILPSTMATSGVSSSYR